MQMPVDDVSFNLRVYLLPNLKVYHYLIPFMDVLLCSSNLMLVLYISYLNGQQDLFEFNVFHPERFPRVSYNALLNSTFKY